MSCELSQSTKKGMPHRKYAATFGDVNVNFSKNKNKGAQ
ncbi:Maltose/maltodextrin ABC transporter, substrate binding periplasmic protein MalE [Pseudomonas chlororaphis subsp. aurantiaca]|nr:Maltose/maltodextrin ABC transporter, substrate binding periplasmic protein MalE [Pseudomonas chlororaphis subsp. aurantiaca]AZD42326.1 Maltose/maltodextrin ABC transporter, substrate binding periplasmic protein MalE [Pseudomonas chlororaphis subsp. aurantiaca]